MADYRFTDAFPYLLNRVGVLMGELFSRHIAPYGVTLPMYRVMAALWERSDLGLGELAAVTSVELSTLSRLVGTMSRRDLVSRRRVEGNGRMVEISLTPSGQQLVELLIPIAVMYEDEALRGLAPKEVDQLRGALLRVCGNLAAFGASSPPGSKPPEGMVAPAHRASPARVQGPKRSR